jgi:hypothetical protein
VFGVPLEDLGKQVQGNLPKFITAILEAIENGVDKIEDEEAKQRLWSTPCALDRVHATCMNLNIRSDDLTVELLEKYDAELLVAVLRYFLLELPECLLTFEFYDPVDALLGGSSKLNQVKRSCRKTKLQLVDVDQDDSLRLASISNLIATLPAAHFVTLKAIFASITR